MNSTGSTRQFPVCADDVNLLRENTNNHITNKIKITVSDAIKLCGDAVSLNACCLRSFLKELRINGQRF